MEYYKFKNIINLNFVKMLLQYMIFFSQIIFTILIYALSIGAKILYIIMYVKIYSINFIIKNKITFTSIAILICTMYFLIFIIIKNVYVLLLLGILFTLQISAKPYRINYNKFLAGIGYYIFLIYDKVI